MPCHDVTLPQCLLDFIDRNMPGVHGAARVKLHCCPDGELPFDSIKRKNGITYFGNIYISETYCPQPFQPCMVGQVLVVFHEFVHIEQQEEQSWLFYPLYLLSALFFGTGSRYEAAARKRADELFDRYKRENPCHCPERDWGERPGPGGPPEPPARPPHQYSEAHVDACCAANRDQLQIHFTPHTGAGATVWADSQCGVRSLKITAVLQNPGSADLPLPPQESSGNCPDYRRIEVSKAFSAPLRLFIQAEAESCCGKKVQNATAVTAA